MGKITAVGACFFILLLSVVIASRGNPYILGATLLVAFVSLLFLISQIKQVFTANPGLSTLEGKEVIQYLEIELKSRGHGPVPGTELVRAPRELVVGSEQPEPEMLEERKDE